MSHVVIDPHSGEELRVSAIELAFLRHYLPDIQVVEPAKPAPIPPQTPVAPTPPAAPATPAITKED